MPSLALCIPLSEKASSDARKGASAQKDNGLYLLENPPFRDGARFSVIKIPITTSTMSPMAYLKYFMVLPSLSRFWRMFLKSLIIVVSFFPNVRRFTEPAEMG